MRAWEIPLTLLAVVFVAFLIFLGAGFVYTSSSYFCASCHEMSTQYISWRRSAHSEVSCMSCHSEPGLIGEVKAHLKGSKQVFIHVSRLYRLAKFIAHVKDGSCLRCHKDIKEENAQFKGIHKSHSKIKVDCADCHAGIVHGDIAGGFPYQKNSCAECHSGRNGQASQAQADFPA